MRIQSVIGHARAVWHNRLDDDTDAARLARGVLDLLEESQPCGFEPPVVDPDMVSILDGSEDPQPAYQFTPSEARWFAKELLVAADEAEALAKERT